MSETGATQDGPAAPRAGLGRALLVVAASGSAAALVGASRALGEVRSQALLEHGFLRSAARAVLDAALPPAGTAALAAAVVLLVGRGALLELPRRIAQDARVRQRALVVVLVVGLALVYAATVATRGPIRIVYASGAVASTACLVLLVLGSAVLVRSRLVRAWPGLLAAAWAAALVAVPALFAQNVEERTPLAGRALFANAGLGLGVAAWFVVLCAAGSGRAGLVTRLLAWTPLALLAALAAAAPALEPGATAGNPKSVVLIGVDTLRLDHTSLARSPVVEHATTPRLQRLADGGVSFRSAVSQAPWTMPAFASVLTGLYPRQHGASHLLGRIDDEHLSLAEVLREAGYRTAGVISNNQIDAARGFAQGFDVWDETNIVGVWDFSSAGVTDRGLELLEELRGGPFFLFLHYFDPHYEFRDHPQWDWSSPSRYDGWLRSGQNEIVNLRHKRHLLTAEDRRYLRDNYAEEVAYTDRQIGRVLDGLDALGLADDVAVVLVADHGEELLEHGWLGHTISMYEEVLSVPLVMRLPGLAPAPPVDEVVETRAVFGTLLEYLDVRGVDRSAPSLLDLARGAREGASDAVAFSSSLLGRERVGSGKRVELYAVRRGDWKLVRDETRDLDLLFDLGSDPFERDDRAAASPELVDALRGLLRGWIDGLGAGEQRVGLGEEQIAELEALGYL